MAWLIIANIVAIVTLAAGCPHDYLQAQTLHGTGCSAFNYSKSCCLPDAECYAMDGQCSCSPDCYRETEQKYKCCKDIHCPNRKLIIIMIIIFAG